jgi:hypothetical protein
MSAVRLLPAEASGTVDMSKELFELVWRIYFIACLILAANATSRFMFKPTLQRCLPTLRAFLFIPFWPLAVFSAEGRAILENKLEHL